MQKRHTGHGQVLAVVGFTGFRRCCIVGSQLTALSILSRFWFPNIPVWVFASGFALLGILVVIIGTRGFEKTQNIFAIIKIAAILMFIMLAIVLLFGFFGGSSKDFNAPTTFNEFMPNGLKGLWASLIFGFYAFGGIEIMGIMSPRLRNKEDAKKSATIMLLILIIIYLISLFLTTSLVTLDKFKVNESPFVVALAKYHLDFFPHVFIACIIIAGFSTMAASLFAITSMVVTLAKDGDAPKIFTKKGKLKVQPFALALTVSGLIASIILSFVMPDRVYEYITTSAGLMLLYNWLFILVSFPRLIKCSSFDHVKRYIGMLLIFIAISGTFIHKASRPGFLVSMIFVVLVVITYLIMNRIKKRKLVMYPKQS